MYACIYVFMYVCMCVCVCVYVCMYVCLFVCLFVGFHCCSYSRCSHSRCSRARCSLPTDAKRVNWPTVTKSDHRSMRGLPRLKSCSTTRSLRLRCRPQNLAPPFGSRMRSFGCYTRRACVLEGPPRFACMYGASLAAERC